MLSPSMVRRAPRRETVGMNFDRSVSIAGIATISGGTEGTIDGTPRQNGTMMSAGPISMGAPGIDSVLVSWDLGSPGPRW